MNIMQIALTAAFDIYVSFISNLVMIALILFM